MGKGWEDIFENVLRNSVRILYEMRSVSTLLSLIIASCHQFNEHVQSQFS